MIVCNFLFANNANSASLFTLLCLFLSNTPLSSIDGRLISDGRLNDKRE